MDPNFLGKQLISFKKALKKVTIARTPANKATWVC
jgi:hypothetical protein